jgi:preprotein translocase subunit SecB
MSDEKIERPTDSPSGEMTSAVLRISNGSDLYDVRTIGTSARLHRDAPETGVALTAGLAINLNCQISGEEFRIIGKFALKAHEERKTEKHSFFSATLRIVAYYRMRSGVQINQEELETFARSNGMIHLWPYFRAFVQQTCGQFSVPPIVLPPFRANRPLNVHFSVDEDDVPKHGVDAPPTEASE